MPSKVSAIERWPALLAAGSLRTVKRWHAKQLQGPGNALHWMDHVGCRVMIVFGRSGRKNDLEQVVIYILEAQDRMDRGKQGQQTGG